MKVNIQHNCNSDKNPVKEVETESQDHWGLDKTLSIVLSRTLKDFKDHLKEASMAGYPDDFNSMDEWLKTIDKMIWSFEAIEEGNYHIYKDYDKTNLNATHERLRVRQKRIQEGLDLFAKYFQGLWD